MSTIGFPDGQRITQWLGTPFAQAAALAIGNVLHTDGPYPVASWASVVVAVKPTGGNVTVTVKQNLSRGPAALELDQTFLVPAGGTTFEAIVLFGDEVTLTMLGSAPGVTVDYAIYPSNSTTNAQVLTQATITVQHNDATVAAEPTLDLEDLANGVLWAVVDDGPGTRVKITPVLGNPFRAPGSVFVNAGGAGEMSLQSNHALYFDNSGNHYIYQPVAGTLQTNDLVVVSGMAVQRQPYGSQTHMEWGVVGVAPGGPGATVAFTSVFASAPVVVATSNSNAIPVAVWPSPSTTGFSLFHNAGSTISAYWIASA